MGSTAIEGVDRATVQAVIERHIEIGSTLQKQAATIARQQEGSV